MADTVPSRDLDGLSDSAVLDLFEKVKQAWSERDIDIGKAIELREQSWKVPVPKAWIKTATQHHTSRSKEIPQRIVGVLGVNKPVFSRPNPGYDFEFGQAENQVERFLQAHFRLWDRTGAKGKSAWEAVRDNMVGKGGVCVGSIKAPQSWADAPLFMDGDAVRRDHWRDSSGKQTDKQDQMDVGASYRAFEKSVANHRQTPSKAGFPLKRRILSPEQTYPIIVEDSLIGLFIERKATVVELQATGWAIDIEAPNSVESFIEFATPNRCRYYWGKKPIRMQGASEDGVVTNYGFVPYVYQTAMSAGETEYGSWGMPLLQLVDSNIRTIDTLRTYLMNAVHLASFPTYYIKYLGDASGRTMATIVEGKTGRNITSFDFKSGMVNDFGPDREILPMNQAAMNADFWKALAEEEADVDRIIPRSFSGEPASSGYNTSLSSVQAKALFVSLFDNSELLLEQLATMDLRHLETLPGPVYLNWEKPSNGRKKLYERVSINKDMIDGYYDVNVSIGRIVDHITEGTFRANMIAQGIGDRWWAAEAAGIEDAEDMEMRQARDRVFKSDLIMQTLEQRAVKKFGLAQAQAEAIAAQRIQIGPDGTPVVNMGDGRQAGPGAGVQTPQGQAGAGAMGGAINNPAPQSTGGPNMATTNNPAMAMPGRAGGNRMRRRGGANPGAPQHRNQPPAPGNPAGRVG